MLASIGNWIASFLMKYVINYIVKAVSVMIETASRRKAQEKKDQETKAPYDEAVKNGTKEEIIKATEDRLNG